ncbi:MAG TPA: ACT domain-containing protein [Myxococcaceae bacterium]
MRGLRLRVLPGRLAVARLPGTAALPGWADGPGLVSITRREGELSIVCAEARVPAEVRAERGWRAVEVEGPLDFQELGVMHGLTGPLAGAGVSVLAISTYDTDVLVVREETLARAVEALRAAGYAVDEASPA